MKWNQQHLTTAQYSKLYYDKLYSIMETLFVDDSSDTNQVNPDSEAEMLFSEGGGQSTQKLVLARLKSFPKREHFNRKGERKLLLQRIRGVSTVPDSSFGKR